jgi:hypothetical protein
MSPRKHAFVENSADKHAALPCLIENNVLPFFDPPKASVNRIATPTKARIERNPSEAGIQTVEVEFSLLRTPHIGRVIGDIGEVDFSQGR